MALALADYVAALVAVGVAVTAGEAMEMLDSGESIAAAIVDVALPDGDGLDLIAAVRPRLPLRPILVLTGFDAWDDVNRAFSLSARYLRKTRDAGALARRVVRFVIPALPDAERALSVVDELCRRFELSERQRDVVRLYIQGCPRDGRAAALEVSENTIESHVRETLRKCRATSLDALCRQILQEALRPSD